jgi:hypothetical protein
MKIKLAEIKMIEGSLKKVVDKDLPIQLAYRFGKFLKSLNIELQNIEEQRIKLIKKYAVQPQQGQEIKVADGKEPDFYNEFNQLLQQEVNIDFDPIPLAAFGDISLSAIDIYHLDKIIFDEKIEKIK